MTKRRRIVIRVQRRPRSDLWWVCIASAWDGSTSRQVDAISMARERVTLALAAGRWVQLVLHGVDGRIRWERTYPRSSDPRRSRG